MTEKTRVFKNIDTWMVAVVEGGLDEVGGDDALALDEDVPADVAVVPGRHQHGGCLARHL